MQGTDCIKITNFLNSHRICDIHALSECYRLGQHVTYLRLDGPMVGPIVELMVLTGYAFLKRCRTKSAVTQDMARQCAS